MGEPKNLFSTLFLTFFHLKVRIDFVPDEFLLTQTLTTGINRLVKFN
jgi:hypothetical protein